MCSTEGCKNSFIENKKRNLCPDCNYFRIHGISKFEAIIQKNKEKQYILSTSNKTPLKTVKNKVKLKKTGERELFIEIWNERPHICINCKKNLGEEMNVWFFSHRVSKGRDSKLRLDKANIDLLCDKCHFAHEHQGIEKYNQRKDKHGTIL